jgi:hypothetical protein
VAKKRKDAQWHMSQIETMEKRLIEIGAPDVRPEHQEEAAVLRAGIAVIRRVLDSDLGSRGPRERALEMIADRRELVQRGETDSHQDWSIRAFRSMARASEALDGGEGKPEEVMNEIARAGAVIAAWLEWTREQGTDVRKARPGTV